MDLGIAGRRALVCAALVVVSMVMIRPRCTPIPRAVIFTWAVLGTGYVAYMFLVDVPMYWARWVADQAAGREYFSILQGVLDATGRRVVTFQFERWHTEMLWMSLYFSVAVWISLPLIHAPVAAARVRSQSPQQRPVPAHILYTRRR